MNANERRTPIQHAFIHTALGVHSWLIRGLIAFYVTQSH